MQWDSGLSYPEHMARPDRSSSQEQPVRRSGIWRVLNAPVDAATALLTAFNPILGFLSIAMDHLAEAAAARVHGDHERDPTPLEAELDHVRSLLAPHRVRLSISAPAMKAMQTRKLGRRAARHFVRAYIRSPLARMIGRDELRNGQLVVVGWDRGITLRAEDEPIAQPVESNSFQRVPTADGP